MTEHILDKQSEKQTTKPPTMWNVIFHNDDYTSFELVIYALVTIFGKTVEQAELIAHAIHVQQKGIAGTYAKDVAETKQQQVLELARLDESPLMVTLEPNA